MSLKQNNNNLPLGRRCLVCDADLGPDYGGIVENREVCKDSQCQHLHKQRLTMPAAVYKPHLAFHRKLIRSRKIREQAKKEHIQHVEKVEREENERIASKLLATSKELENRKIDVVMIPTGLSETLRQEAHRIEAYRIHLEQIIEDAIKAEHVDAVPIDQHSLAQDRLLQLEAQLDANPDIRSRSDHLCSICKGGCCASGGNHAFISAITIRRQLDADPDLDKGSIIDLYLRNLPPLSINGACINQTDQGCALPRELRSDVCNVYFCDELKSYQNRLQNDTDQHSATVVIQRSNHNWNRYETPDINTVTGVFLIKDGQTIELEGASAVLPVDP